MIQSNHKHNKFIGNKVINTNKNNPAFTIIELLIVIVIIGILVAITAVAYTGITKQANAAATKADLANFKRGLEVYALRNDNKFPTTKAEMTEAGLGGMMPKVAELNNTFFHEDLAPVRRGECAVSVYNDSTNAQLIHWNYKEGRWGVAVYWIEGDSVYQSVDAGPYVVKSNSWDDCTAETLDQCGVAYGA